MNASSLFSGTASVINPRPDGEAPPLGDLLNGTGGGTPSFCSELENHLQESPDAVPLAETLPVDVVLTDKSANENQPLPQKTEVAKDLALVPQFRFQRPVSLASLASVPVKTDKAPKEAAVVPLEVDDTVTDEAPASEIKEEADESSDIKPEVSKQEPAYPVALMQSLAVADLVTPPPVPPPQARPIATKDNTSTDTTAADVATTSQTQAESSYRPRMDRPLAVSRAPVASAQVLSMRDGGREPSQNADGEVSADSTRTTETAKATELPSSKTAADPKRNVKLAEVSTKGVIEILSQLTETGTSAKTVTEFITPKLESGLSLESGKQSVPSKVPPLPLDQAEVSNDEAKLLPSNTRHSDSFGHRVTLEAPSKVLDSGNEQVAPEVSEPGRNVPTIELPPAESTGSVMEQISVDLQKEALPVVDSPKNYAKPRSKPDSKVDGIDLNPTGTGAAKPDSAMSARKSVEWEKSASSLVYRAGMSSSDKSNGSAEADFSRQIQMMLNQPDTKESKANAVDGSPISSAKTESKVADIEKLQTMFLREVRYFKQTGAESMRMVIEPSPDTRLSLHLQMADGRVSAEMRCEQGDTAMLQSQWGELQAVMASQGVDLNDWSGQQNSGSNPPAEPKANLSMDQNTRDERQREPVFQTAEERMNELARFNRFTAKTVREELTTGATSLALAHKLESWA